ELREHLALHVTRVLERIGPEEGAVGLGPRRVGRRVPRMEVGADLAGAPVERSAESLRRERRRRRAVRQEPGDREAARLARLLEARDEAQVLAGRARPRR